MSATGTVKRAANKWTVLGLALGILAWPRLKGKINMPS